MGPRVVVTLFIGLWERLNAILKMQFSDFLYWLVPSNPPLIISSDEYHETSYKVNQIRSGQWVGAVRQQAITWVNVEPDSSMSPYGILGHNALI